MSISFDNSYVSHLKRQKDLQNFLSSEPGHLQTLVNNINKRSPGWLLKTTEIDNYQIPRVLRQNNIYEKKDYKIETGKFYGQPGVLHRFGRNPRFN